METILTALKINGYACIYQTDKVTLFSVKNNDLWRIFDNGGEVAIDKPNTDFFANVPTTYGLEILPPVEIAKRIEEVVSGKPIDFERYRSFTREDIEVLWTVKTPIP